MGKMRGKIKIELMSDLCVGSGYSHAGIINSDVFYDEFGIPVIPARRMKGCMREAAELICSDDEINKIFGNRGECEAKGIVIGNAFIEDYMQITEELNGLRAANAEVFSYLSAQNILEIYTNVRAQTKIENKTGVADDNSLRYTRVIGKRNPFLTDQPMYFFADIEFEEEDKELLENILKATRNIGMNRNRGLGSVRCSLDSAKRIEKENVPQGSERQGRACITYVLRNDAPLIMSSLDDRDSDSFISGKSVLGKIAGAFLKIPGNSAESEEFKNLFLDGATIFSNAYITFCLNEQLSNKDSWGTYIPAPGYLKRLKISKELVNVMAPEKADGSLEKGIPKKLKTHYVCETAENEYHVVETEKEVIYHHRRERENVEELLYAHEVLRKGQYFKGCIYTDWKYVPILEHLFKNAGLRFGKSRTVQYGYCKLVDFFVEEEQEKRIEVKTGDTIAVTLCSDSIFMDTCGYTVKFEEVKKQIADRLGIMYRADEKDTLSIVQTTEIAGYNTKWNLKRPSIPAIKAGSVFVYSIENLEDKKILSAKFVGERNLEGFGEVRFSEIEKMSYLVKEYDIQKKVQKENPDQCKEHLKKILSKKILDQLIYDYYVKETVMSTKITSSIMGRVILMLKESLNEHENDKKAAKEDFDIRVDSIKRVDERKEIKRLLESAWPSEKEMSAGLKTLLEISGKYCSADYQKMQESLWGAYLMSVLVYCKYRLNHKDAGGKKQ